MLCQISLVIFTITNSRSSGSKALFYYKKWSTSGKWSPEEGIQPPKKPAGAPRLIDPNESTLSLEKLRQDIPKYHLHFDSETIKCGKSFLRVRVLLLARHHNGCFHSLKNNQSHNRSNLMKQTQSRISVRH